MVSDVPVDDEALVVTSGIFRFAGAQSFGGAYRGRVCVRVFIGCECACVLLASSLYCVILKKNVAEENHQDLPPLKQEKKRSFGTSQFLRVLDHTMQQCKSQNDELA